jgi:PiT family inorganic phosphate transporter
MMLAELSTGAGFFLVLAIGLALAFEFVNGFHDTANAVATVIYTHTLKPWVAVVWSGCWNLIGVLTSAGGIAFTILALLPVELVVNVGSNAGFAMVFALLISAIIWNLGTWYLGLPASSSHTLIGAILGVGLANAWMKGSHSFGDGVNWGKVQEVFLSLIVSPLVGFLCSGALLLILKGLIKKPELFKAPPKDAPPPPWIRGLLVLTCTGVSFGHGSNDGQKGMGLLLLILIGILPGMYALNPATKGETMSQLQATSVQVQSTFDKHVPVGATVSDADAPGELSAYLKANGKLDDKTYASLALMNRKITETLGTRTDFQSLSVDERKNLRTEIYLVGATVGKLDKQHLIKDATEKSLLLGDKGYKSQLEHVTQFIPFWVKVAVAFTLGLGTMIGWKRIVTTVGEKIGKDHLTYAQGASAELIAATTIILADQFHLPVSTTHVLSSGVAGTMAANRSGLQVATLRNLLLAWVLTLPVCVLLGAATFAGGLYVVLNNLVPALLWIVGILIAVVSILVLRRMVRKSSELTVEMAATPGN